MDFGFYSDMEFADGYLFRLAAPFSLEQVFIELWGYNCKYFNIP